jgi:hypothetical protein
MDCMIDERLPPPLQFAFARCLCALTRADNRVESRRTRPHLLLVFACAPA